MIAFLVLGMFLLHTIRRNFSERQEYTNKARILLHAAKSLREGESHESIKHLDAIMADTLHRTAYNISGDKMAELDPEILRVWQEFKEYDDAYNVESYNWGLVHKKLAQVPWSNFQLAIRKFEQTYGSGKLAAAPGVKIKSWITKTISNEELSNKVILLDFWNIHCGPCIKSFPELQKLYDKYEEQGLVVIACAGGNEKETKKFLDKHEYSFPVGMASYQMHLDYAVRGNPSYFLIDRNSYLVWGPEDRLPTDDELEKMLEANQTEKET
jgi:thiol-disulfide isomerase/thioredoxin